MGREGGAESDNAEHVIVCSHLIVVHEQVASEGFIVKIAVKGGRTPHVSQGIFEIPLPCYFVGDRKKPTDVCPRQIVYGLVHFFKIGE